MTQEEYDSIKPYTDLMRTIIINSAASNIPIAYRELVLKLNKQRGYSICNCSSGIFQGTTRLYKELLAYEKAKTETETKPTKSNTKTNKRK